jgi:hypothetical protein
MDTMKVSTLMLATVATLGIGISSAFAQGSAAESGYVYPDFWGTAATQPAPQGHIVAQPNGDSVGTYVTHSEHNGTWLFPPDPWDGGNG